MIRALGRDQVIAIGDKTRRRPKSKAGEPLHLVSAPAAKVGIVRGQTVTAEEANETTAIPKLLHTLDVKVSSWCGSRPVGLLREVVKHAGEACQPRVVTLGNGNAVALLQ